MLTTFLLLGILQATPVQSDTTAPGKSIIQGDTLTKTDSTQTIFRTQTKDPDAFMMQQVTYVSEFIQRFNNQRNADGKPIPDSLQNTASRKQVVYSLFDRFGVQVLNKTSSLNRLRTRFVEQVCDETQPIRLTFLSDSLFAVVRVQLAYGGKEQPVDFYLKSVAEGKGHAWKILDAQAPFLSAKEQRSFQRSPVSNKDAALFIPLNAQETAFLNLYNHIRDRHDLLRMAAQPEQPTPSLAHLAKLVREGQLTPIYTEYPQVYLPMAQGWVIQLTFNNRRHENSGWLISDLYQLPGGDEKRLPSLFLAYFMSRSFAK